MAKILHGIELIATDTIVETSGLDLTGEYLGQTKKKVEEKMGQAKGGVLFIDEAYELGKGHYGEEAMTTLLAGMTSPEYKGMVIIIAGYQADINDMLDRNVGLKSRFTQQFDFLSWSPQQCYVYFKEQAARDAFVLEAACEKDMIDGCSKLIELPGWGNGRDLTQLWKSTVSHRANRIVDSSKAQTTKTITSSDVLSAINDMLQRRKVDPSVDPAKKTPARPMFYPPPRPQEQHAKQHKPSFSHHTHTTTNTDTDVKEDVKMKEEEKQNIAKDLRDDGVTDEQWEELEKAKVAHAEKLERMKREFTAEQLREEQRKAQAIQEKIRQIVPCPMGFAWLKVGGGWRCAGGSHYVSDAQLMAQFSV